MQGGYKICSLKQSRHSRVKEVNFAALKGQQALRLKSDFGTDFQAQKKFF